MSSFEHCIKIDFVKASYQAMDAIPNGLGEALTNANPSFSS